MIIFMIELIIILLIPIMKLQKLQKPRQNKETSKAIAAGLLPFNQTIIINSPNVKISYHQTPSLRQDPLSSRGIQNWHLNTNLKEFSKTRQLGFCKFKRHNERNKSNSPYIIHKVRTQDIKSMNKIYCGKAMKDTLADFHKNQTIAQIIREEKVEPNPPTVLEKILTKQEKTSTEKFYIHYHKKSPRIQLQKNFQTLPTTFLASHLPSPEIVPKTFRKNRFQIAGQNITALTERINLPPTQQALSPHPQSLDLREDEDDDDEGFRIEPRSFPAKMVPLESKKREFNKTIESINRGLLSHADSYLQHTFLEQAVPLSQIQLCVNSLTQPEHGRSVNQRSSQRSFNDWGEYDFDFDQQRKKRPNTPRREKTYDPNESLK